MYVDVVKERTINYVTRCRCVEGGFCFYRLEEPNASDTYYALSILNLLGIDIEDDDTVFYLKNLQKKMDHIAVFTQRIIQLRVYYC